MSRFGKKTPMRAYRTTKGGPNVYRCPSYRAELERPISRGGKRRSFLRCPGHWCHAPLHLRGRYRGKRP